MDLGPEICCASRAALQNEPMWGSVDGKFVPRLGVE